MECPKCGSKDRVKNGQALGKQRYKCKGCRCNFTQSRKQGTTLEVKLQALQLYLEGMGFRAIGRLLKVSNVTVLYWIRNFGKSVKSYVQTGSRGQKAFKTLLRQLQKYPIKNYATDTWKIYENLPSDKHLIGKQHTTRIESLNANVRHYLARFRRRARCYSKCPLMVELSLFLLFFKNLISILF